jgi:hypothetical protein
VHAQSYARGVLVRRDEEGALAIGQLSHSWLSGQLARAWGNDRIAAPHAREEIALGAEQHDIGWALFDLRPRLSPETGLPCSFVETTVHEHLEIWETAPDRLLSQSQRAALVVSLHGRSLSELRLGAAADEDKPALVRHIESERERQARLRQALGLSEETMQEVQRQMWTWDGLSLALCNGWDPFTARDVPAAVGLTDIELSRNGDGTYTLAPWPFPEHRLAVRCEARRLASSYEDETTLHHALADTPPQTLEFTLVEASGS